MKPMFSLLQLYETKKPLRIGYYCSDGNVPPIPGVARAVEEAKQALERMGHTVSASLIPSPFILFFSICHTLSTQAKFKLFRPKLASMCIHVIVFYDEYQGDVNYSTITLFLYHTSLAIMFYVFITHVML